MKDWNLIAGFLKVIHFNFQGTIFLHHPSSCIKVFPGEWADFWVIAGCLNECSWELVSFPPQYKTSLTSTASASRLMSILTAVALVLSNPSVDETLSVLHTSGPADSWISGLVSLARCRRSLAVLFGTIRCHGEQTPSLMAGAVD